MCVIVSIYDDVTKGRVRLPNRMNFQKNSKRPSIPPPVFLENYIAIFLLMDHSEGLGMGVNWRLEPFRKFILFGTLTRPLD